MVAASAVDRVGHSAFAHAGRLQGVDLARGLAVLGMLAAHLLALPTWDWSDPSTWGDIANGRPSILFAVLAGASIALVTGGTRPLPPGPLLARARWALVVRAAALWLIGLVLIGTGVPVFVILPAYGVLFLLSLPLLRVSARALWVLAGILALVMPWLQPLFNTLPLWQGEAGFTLALLLGWHYPFTVWSAFLVAGLAAGRSGLGVRRTQVTLLVSGAALAAIGYGASAALGSAPEQEASSYLSAVLTARPHSSGLFEVIGSGGVALAVIGLCSLACRVAWIAAAALPLRAVGSMPLTAYVGQLAVWALVTALVFGDTSDLTDFRALQPFWPIVLGTLAFCTLWALTLGRGPLERLLAWLSRRLTPR